jgi:hypothetical protein
MCGRLLRVGELCQNSAFQHWCAQIALGNSIPNPRSNSGKHISCPPKRLARAVEKLWRSYHGDHRKWVDLVRASIVFDDLEALVDCFGRIRQDDRVHVRKVKNRLSRSYDALGQSAGYRDMCILLSLLPEAWPAEEDNLRGDYLCELQLQWKPFYEKKSGDGHKRYVEFRNGLAE